LGFLNFQIAHSHFWLTYKCRKTSSSLEWGQMASYN